jgi:hypothetical protein
LTTLNLQVASGTDNANEVVSTGEIWLNPAANVTFGYVNLAMQAGLRFAGVSGLAGAMINSATLSFRAGGTLGGSFIGDWYAQQAAAPATFTSTAYDVSGRTRTTATCEGDGSDFGDWTAGTWYTFTGDGVNTIAGIIQELANAYNPTAIALLHIYTSGSTGRRARTYNYYPSYAPKLDIDYTAATGAQTLTPDPVSATWTVPSATVSPGAATIDAGVAVATWDVMDVTLLSPKTLTPDPVVATWDVPAVTLLSPKTLTPDPVVMTWTVPAHMIQTTSANQTMKPDPVVATWDVPAATIVPGAVSLTPAPVVATWSVVAPTVTGLVTLTPSPVVATWAVVTPTVVPGAATITALPVVATWAVPEPTMIGAAVGVAWATWLNTTRLINPNAYTSTVKFRLEVIVKTSASAVPVYARLYNMTDGVPVSGSQISSTATTSTRVRSDQFTLISGAKEYAIQYGGERGGVFVCYGGDLIVEAS